MARRCMGYLESDMSYIFILIYLSGCIGAVSLFRNVFQRKDLKVLAKMGLCLYVLIFSWIGYFTYTLAVKPILDARSKPRE